MAMLVTLGLLPSAANCLQQYTILPAGAVHGVHSTTLPDNRDTVFHHRVCVCVCGTQDVYRLEEILIITHIIFQKQCFIINLTLY